MKDLNCATESRRNDVRKATLLGLDYVEVNNTGRTLEAFFLGRAPKNITAANIQITGGRRIRNLHVTNLRVHRQKDQTLDDWMELTVDKTGDFSDYTLTLVKVDAQGHSTGQPLDDFDPLYSSATFNFKAGCPSDLDCKQAKQCPAPASLDSEINYLAKDYGSFRQLILDRLAQTLPNWKETHVPDIGIMLVELLAYVGDYLSYFQDAVATEAYLSTAKQRISVRRHARLVDYRMHEGCNARTWVTVSTDRESFPLDLANVLFTTAIPGKIDQRVFQADDLRFVPPGSYLAFRALLPDASKTINLRKAHSEIHFYTWGNTECCLELGATSATLTDAWVQQQGPPPQARGGDTTEEGPTRSLQLTVDDVLILEEVIGRGTGNPADADPSRRHAVRLTKVVPSVDPLYHQQGTDFEQPVLEIEWCSTDALPFPLCLSTRLPAPDCSVIANVSVARGNVILVDQGTPVSEPIGTVPAGSSVAHCACDCQPPYVETTAGSFCPVLHHSPLTFAQPLPPCGCAAMLLQQDPREALPEVSLRGTQSTPAGDVTSSWSPVSDLLESGPDDDAFVIEVDNAGRCHLRFGDGDLGRAPDAGIAFSADYRTGNGSEGNVGAEAIVCIVFTQETGNADDLRARNPMAAEGGTDPEPVEEVKKFAPGAFRNKLQRAITADDYAALASDNTRRLVERVVLESQALEESSSAPVQPVDRASVEEEAGDEPSVGPEVCTAPFQRLQNAKARLRWTGSWTEVSVAVDPFGVEDADSETLLEIGSYLEPYRRIGHDLRVQQAEYVGLDIALGICVHPDYLLGHVEAALLDVLSNRALPDGSLGMFHPDNLTFGEDVYASRIIAAAQGVEGVRSVQLLRLERQELDEPPTGVEPPSEELPPNSVLRLGDFEIARVDNDPNCRENGRLSLLVEGGR
jgi:hypothetical protein